MTNYSTTIMQVRYPLNSNEEIAEAARALAEAVKSHGIGKASLVLRGEPTAYFSNSEGKLLWLTPEGVCTAHTRLTPRGRIARTTYQAATLPA